MSTYFSALIMLVIVLIAHVIGTDNFLYVRISGYDIMMHIIGGMGIALFLAALLKSYKSGIFFTLRNLLCFVVVAGIVWELFEVYFNITGHPVGSKLYYIDTIKDLIDDTVGGAIVAYFLMRKKHAIAAANQEI